MKKNVLVGFLMTMICAIAFTACESGGLSGTWVNTEDEVIIVFSGKSFTLQQRGFIYEDWYTKPLYFTDDEWIAAKDTEITQFGRYDQRYVISKGTYSITNDEIELVYSDGNVAVYDFSRTDNTIKIDEIRLTLK